jgi:hypothetical protein
MTEWTEEQMQTIVTLILRPNFFDHVVTKWAASGDHYEERIYNALRTDPDLRTKIATEVVKARGHIGGNFGKNKDNIEKYDDVILRNDLMNGFDKMTVKKVALPDLEYADAWEQRNQNSEMPRMAGLLARVRQCI